MITSTEIIDDMAQTQAYHYQQYIKKRVFTHENMYDIDLFMSNNEDILHDEYLEDNYDDYDRY